MENNSITAGIYDKRLDNMSLLEIFQECKEHLLKQNAKSMLHTCCAYRGENGMKCAAGIFIPDENITANTNLGMAWDLPAISLGLSCIKSDLILDLQDLHDTAPVEDWPELLDAMEYDLRKG